MKKIPLTNSPLFALVDDEDYNFLMQWKWKIYKGYAYRNTRKNGKSITIIMSRLINNTPSGIETDHRDRNKLNNQRYNLRDATTQQNAFNRKMFHKNKIGFKGVVARNKKFMATIYKNGVSIYLGMHDTPLLAAAAYNDAALKYHGEFARLNDLFPMAPAE